MLHNPIRTTALFFLFAVLTTKVSAQVDCAGAATLTPGTSCSPTTANIKNATSTTPTTGGCGGTAYGEWYKFTASTSTATITVSGLGSSLVSTTTYVELLTGTCGSFTSVCQNVSTSLSATGLTSGVEYYIRVYVTTNPNNSGNPNQYDYSICVVSPPANDNCLGATTLTSGVVNSSGTVWNATASSSIPTGCITGDPDDDVWYTITPAANNLNISLSAIGANLTTSGARLQLFSGSCAGLISEACGTTSIAATVFSGNPYFIRVYSAGTGSIGGVAAGSAFSITATSTAPPTSDECSSAVILTNGVANNAGTVWGATASSGIPVGCATGNPDDDVWYRFTPAGISMTVALSSIDADLTTSGARLQIFSGACGSLTSVACGTTSITTAVNLGDVYYIRVYSAGTGAMGSAAGAGFSITASSTAPAIVTGGRMKEVYMQTTLSGSNIIADPWEVTYGPDDKLWITEAKGYRVFRMDPSTGVKTTVLDISQNSTFLPLADRVFNCQFNNGSGAQGGCAGLAIHPDFMHPTTPKKYVYLSYIYSYTGGSAPSGQFYVNRVVRFTYNTSTEQLESPVSLCDTLPGSNDHNSQRMIIAPVGGTDYLFYASGDMGAGQFDNRTRPIKSQNPASYEGKILRFNLEADADAGLSAWIPNDNPIASNSAVWCTGIRNNQGFAYDPETGLLYGSSHGPYSDDEINILESARNYGHPLVIGYAADGNYNGSGAGSNSGSSIPVITSETDNATITIGSSYKDALFSAYPTTQANINNIYLTNPGNGGWPSEGWSGMDIYKNTVVPGWKNSLVVSSLKWGRVLKLKLGSNGTTIIPTGAYDTVSYFGSQNRFRDVAFSPSGKDLFVVMERSTTSSGPSSANPIVPACLGCVQKYTFLGYADASGKSSIPTSIDVTAGTLNGCTQGTTVTIDNTNNNLWVPITGPDGNIMAEIKANGQNLGAITSSFYTNSGSLRQKSGVLYLDRNITITPAVQPTLDVAIRLYFSKTEFDLLDADGFSGISSIGGVKILKNSDACGAAFTSVATAITPVYAEAHGANGYMLQANISGFSSFYFASQNITLPLELLSFKGSLQGNTAMLKWETSNETNTSHFSIERSVDGRNFDGIGTVTAGGNTQIVTNYSYPDNDVTSLSVNRIYYRLKMFDDNGEYTYSSVITIALPDITGRVTVFPNPVEKEMKATITATVSGKAQWSLVDNSGRILLQGTKELIKGYNELIIDMNKMASGVYYLNVSSAVIDQRIKVQKM